MDSSANKNDVLKKENKFKNTNIIRIHSIIKFTIIIGWISLALITSIIIIFEYGSIHESKKATPIEMYWHLAITIFIIVLACSFFLQTLLMEIENKNDLRNKIIHALNHEHRNYFLKKSKFKEKESESFTVENDNKIKVYQKKIDEIIEHLEEENNPFLDELYRQIYNMIMYFDIIKESPDVYEYSNSLQCQNLDSELKDPKKYLNILRELSEFHIPDNILDCFIDKKIERDGLALGSYILPLSFFLFIYFIGIVAILPLINSVFEPNSNSEIIPFPNTILNTTTNGIDKTSGNNTIDKTTVNITATDTIPSNNTANKNNKIQDNSSKQGIPIIIIQWGFLGGLVYTSIGLLRRFLRKDLPPRVYYNAAFRLLLSGVAAVIIFFLFFTFGYNFPTADLHTISFLLLLCFSIGIAPIKFLIRSADSILSKFLRWRHRRTAGKRSLTNIEGIDSVDAERLSEEGLDYIQQLALCDPIDLSFKTKFPIHTVKDWKDQAILYLLTADIIVIKKDKTKNQKTQFLNYNLDDVYGIRRFSQFYQIVNKLLINDENDQYDQKSINEKKLLEFGKGLGYTDLDSFKFKYILESICRTGISMSELFFRHEKNLIKL